MSCIIYYNNREIVFEPGNKTAAQKTVHADSVVQKQKQVIATKIVNSAVDSAKELIKFKAESDSQKKRFDSVLVSGIEFRPDDRHDVMLKLSLRLCFADSGMRSEILLRREEIRVIARNIMHNLEFGAIKKETLEPRICLAVKSIFDSRNLDDVKIAELQIEKVQKP
ncbi:MAG TPA: hypothetical protein VHP36_08005 [Chitinispirillaceae bacterium]|nr:hypothetical protein [Chitinispirillaceae bacterium]